MTKQVECSVEFFQQADTETIGAMDNGCGITTDTERNDSRPGRCRIVIAG
jgi:hypothetical protein